MNQALANNGYEPDEDTVQESDAKIMRKIRRITDHGNNAEVKRRKDGRLTVYEVKKNIVE